MRRTRREQIYLLRPTKRLNERCRHFADGPFDEISGAFFENVRVSGEEANIWSVRLTLPLIYHDCNA